VGRVVEGKGGDPRVAAVWVDSRERVSADGLSLFEPDCIFLGEEKKMINLVKAMA